MWYLIVSIPDLCNLITLKSERVSSTSVRKEHEDFMEILGKESLSYSLVKTLAAEFKRERERAMGMMDGLAAPKMPPLMKMSRLCTPWLCVIGGKTCEA